MPTPFDIERLGTATVASPILLSSDSGNRPTGFTPEDAGVLADVSAAGTRAYVDRGEMPPSLEIAGPRQRIYFDPSKLKVGIVTCGGLCPGLNDVIRGLVMTLHHGYGVASIFGFRYGYGGLNPQLRHPVIELTPDFVRNIHTVGGTVLGTSRGPQDPGVMADTLDRMNIQLLFVIGGDGTFRGALALHEEIHRRGLKIGIVAIPKTIDNDIPQVDHTFGFETAVALAADAIRAAYAEANSAQNGIGLVKLMGRHCGFIAANAALAVRNVNLVLIPEVPFDLEGEDGLYDYLEQRFRQHKSTVVVAAEGAGQQHLTGTGATDASGNVRLGDIGWLLKERIEKRFANKYPFTLKYIDPSYMIRSAPACASDSIYCGYLAQAAAHAGMSGRTAMAVGRSHNTFTHIPLAQLVSARKFVDPDGELWRSVLGATGQPLSLSNKAPAPTVGAECPAT